MRLNLVSVDQQKALRALYSQDFGEVRKAKIAKLRRVALMYNPADCLGFVCVYWYVGLSQYYAAV